MRCEMKDGAELNGRGRRHIGRLEKKCKSDLKALYAGYIEDAYRRVMFFYTDKASRIEALDDMADRERYLYCSAGASDDPEWNTYLNLLYPDAAKYYTETNRKNAQLYRKNGDCITAVRRLTLHMAFSLETLVPQFAEEARLSGFAIGDAEFNPDIDLPYGVKLHIISSLLNEDLDKFSGSQSLVGTDGGCQRHDSSCTGVHQISGHVQIRVHVRHDHKALLGQHLCGLDGFLIVRQQIARIPDHLHLDEIPAPQFSGKASDPHRLLGASCSRRVRQQGDSFRNIV